MEKRLDNISEWLRQWRLDHCYTQGELAVRLGVNLSSLQGWERGYVKPNTDNWQKLSQLLKQRE